MEGNFLNAFNLDFLMTPPKEHLNNAAEHSVDPKTNITAEELNLLPLKAFTGKVSVITDAEKLSKALKEMEKYDAVGFDTETRPSFKKGQSYNVALLQLALPHKVFLIRLHHTGVTDELAAFFENENIVKAGVAIRDDIKALQKNKRFQPQGFVELATLSKEKGLQVESVKKLTGLLLGGKLLPLRRNSWSMRLPMHGYAWRYIESWLQHNLLPYYRIIVIVYILFFRSRCVTKQIRIEFKDLQGYSDSKKNNDSLCKNSEERNSFCQLVQALQIHIYVHRPARPGVNTKSGSVRSR